MHIVLSRFYRFSVSRAGHVAAHMGFVLQQLVGMAAAGSGQCAHEIDGGT